MKSSSRARRLPQEACQTLTMVLIVRVPHPSRIPFRCPPPVRNSVSPLRIASLSGRPQMSVLRLTCLNLSILAAFGLQADAVFGQVFNGLQKPVGSGRSTQGPHYFTILGHIAKPNCYELPTSSPPLVSFVELAGNLTATAAGPIRIIRDGRMVHSTYYSDKRTMRLVPGDIVVADGKFNQGRVILRGNQSPSDDPQADVTLAITGLRDYPVVMTIAAERATIRWVTRHLGLDPNVANYVKAITQRQSEPVFQDKRLTTGTVLVFNPAYVDASRLPDDLPVPVNPVSLLTSAQPQIQRPTGTPAPRPLAGPPAIQYSAAPGRARVPTISPNSPLTNGQAENLPREEQTFVHRLLTDPASVPLDEPAPTPEGRAITPQAPANTQPQISSTTDSPNAIQNRAASTNAIGSAPTTDVARRPDSSSAATDTATDSPPRYNFNFDSKGSFSSPEAARPYQSAPATPEPLRPFGSSLNNLKESVPQPETDAGNSNSQTGTTREPGNASGFPMATEDAGRAATNMASDSNPPNIEGGNESPASIPSASSQASVTPSGPVQSTTPPEILREQTGPSALTNSTYGSRLLPPPPNNLNWPVISILTVGFLGAIAACFLIYSIAHENPTPRSAQIDTSGRYWLDRMIENDIPIEDEEVDYPHNTQLFGKPAPIQRVDAAHRSVPRPHFSAPGGKSGVLKNNPAAPDAPSPDISASGQKRIVKVHAGGPTKAQAAAAVPNPHSVGAAAEQRQEGSALSEFAATAIFGDAGQDSDAASDTDERTLETPAKPGRQFRLDTGHKKQETPAGRPATTRKPVTVQPSPVVAQGANLLDRILSSVDHEQKVTRPKADNRHPIDLQSDERGQS